MATNRPTEGGRRTASAGVPKHQHTILIVEDDEDLRHLTVVRLRREGYVTVPAGDVAQAVAAVAEHAPDLILLDIGLPGEDGYTLLEHLRIHQLRTPVIVVSGYNGAVHGPKARAAGAVAFLQKPVDFVILLSAMQLVLPDVQERREDSPRRAESSRTAADSAA